MLTFFATDSDLVDVLRDVSNLRPIDIALAGMFPAPRPRLLAELSEVRPFTTYIFVDRAAAVRARSVPQRTGGQVYAFDQLLNTHGVSLRTGGKVGDEQLAPILFT